MTVVSSLKHNKKFASSVILISFKANADECIVNNRCAHASKNIHMSIFLLAMHAHLLAELTQKRRQDTEASTVKVGYYNGVCNIAIDTTAKFGAVNRTVRFALKEIFSANCKPEFGSEWRNLMQSASKPADFAHAQAEFLGAVQGRMELLIVSKISDDHFAKIKSKVSELVSKYGKKSYDKSAKPEVKDVPELDNMPIVGKMASSKSSENSFLLYLALNALAGDNIRICDSNVYSRTLKSVLTKHVDKSNLARIYGAAVDKEKMFIGLILSAASSGICNVSGIVDTTNLTISMIDAASKLIKVD